MSALPRGGKGIDPLELLPLARKQAGLEADAVLLEVEAHGVGPGGRVDIGTNDGSIIFTLSDPPSIPPTERRWRQVEVRATGTRVGADETRGPLPSKYGIELPPPHCTFAHALGYMTLERKTPVAGARLTYGPDVGGHQGRWTLEDASSGERAINDVECEAWGALAH